MGQRFRAGEEADSSATDHGLQPPFRNVKLTVMIGIVDHAQLGYSRPTGDSNEGVRAAYVSLNTVTPSRGFPSPRSVSGGF